MIIVIEVRVSYVVMKRIFDVIEGLIKERALACSSERGERVEPVVRLGTVAAVTQKEKAGTADDNVGFGKLIVTLSGINQLLLIMPVTLENVLAMRCCG
ncbi:MAG: hypothetical protein U1A62_31405 [Pseudomonas sp.]|nr:hypothetical protein [Pseudomonas sp.]